MSDDNISGDSLSQVPPPTSEEAREFCEQVRWLAKIAARSPNDLPAKAKRLFGVNGPIVRWTNWLAENGYSHKTQHREALASLSKTIGRIVQGLPPEAEPYADTLNGWADDLEPLLFGVVSGAPNRRWYPGCEIVQLAKGLEASLKRQVESVTSWVTLFGIEASPASEGTTAKIEPGISKVEPAHHHTPKQTASEGKKPIKPSKETIRRFQALRDKEKMSWPEVERKHGDGCSQRNLRRLASEIGYDIEKRVFTKPLSELASALLEVEEKKRKKNER